MKGEEGFWREKGFWVERKEREIEIFDFAQIGSDLKEYIENLA